MSVPNLAPLLARAELVRAEAVAAVVAARRRREAPAQGPREQRDEAAPERAEVAAAARLALEAELLAEELLGGGVDEGRVLAVGGLLALALGEELGGRALLLGAARGDAVGLGGVLGGDAAIDALEHEDGRKGGRRSGS